MLYWSVNQISIYGLFDPRKPNALCVIGKTSQPLNYRLHGYINEARRKKRLGCHLMPSLVWVLDLLNKGLKPEIRLLLMSSKAMWKKDERGVLAFYRNDGHPLLNVRDGGDGPEDGFIKEFCESCGTKRKQYPNGRRYCPKCKLNWQKTEAGRANGRLKTKRFRSKPENKQRELVLNRTRMKIWRQTEHGRKYRRDWEADKRRRIKETSPDIT